MLLPVVLQIIYKSKHPVTISDVCRRIKHSFRDLIAPQVSLKTAVIECTLQLCSFGYILHDPVSHCYKLSANWQSLETATFQNRLRKILNDWPKPIRKKRYVHVKLSRTK
uniref:Winged helix Storkhead-box1 domain-containing protein n=1 Tax=Anopheles atroparvus TaxID=41427 RepID=A0AAG5CWD1_ANOAO